MKTESFPDKPTLDRLLELGGSIKAQSIGDGETHSDPFVILPTGMKTESLAGLLPPRRIKRTVSLLEAGSFAEYVNRFKTDNTLIFAGVTESGVTFTAMLDYHSKSPELKASFCSHSATFTAIETPEWITWKEADRNRFSQVDFAEWLEDNAKLLVNPKGADLLELVRSLHGHKNARFNTTIRLDNGAQSVSYDEDIVIKGNATTTSDKMDLPPTIQAGIAVFQGAAPYAVDARLKARVEDRQLQLYFETVALHAIVRESILLLTKQIAEATGIVPLLGNP